MQAIETLLDGQRVGVVSAHPDDHAVHGNALYIARLMGVEVYELTLTRGLQSTVNYHPDAHFVQQGRRTEEGETAAAYLGILANEHTDLPDGGLADETSAASRMIIRWARRRQITTLLTLGGLTDHADHSASAHAARLAARTLRQEGQPVDILELQHGLEGNIHAATSEPAIQTTLGAAHLHACQFLIKLAVVPGWEQITPELAVHPASMAGLDQYPIRRDATYVHLPADAS